MPELDKMKTIIVNWNDIKSIKRAERQKSKLENDGYNLLETRSSLFTATLIYTK